jgi:hypothetical protein
MLKRTAFIVLTAGVLPLLVFGGALAGGGFFPLFPPAVGLTNFNTSGQVTAVIVLDPNGPVLIGAPATPTGTVGSIAITRKRVGTASAAFHVQPGSSLGELRFGCNLLLTNPRFLELAPGTPGLPLGSQGGFDNWLSSDLTKQLFAQLGTNLTDAGGFTILMVPGIAEIVSQTCVRFPRAKDTTDFLPFADVLDDLRIRPLPPKYPDLTIPGVTDPTQQWFPGFLVLVVKIGFWAAPGTVTP